jgi:hypothetical protein
MPATGRHYNIGPCSFTPTSGTLIALSGVQSLRVPRGVTPKKFRGGSDIFHSTVVVDIREPKVMIDFANINAFVTLPLGVFGAFSGVILDAKNGTGSGGVTVALANCAAFDDDISQAHGDFGKCSATFHPEVVDGVTSPLTFTVAS